MLETLLTVLLGAVGSILAAWIIYQLQFGKRLYERALGLPLRLARILADGGIRRFTLSRADYHKYRTGAGTLRDYLATAKHSIDIVSISMNVTNAEGALVSLFEKKLSEDENFRIRITLLNPQSPVVPLLAKSLDLTELELRKEITILLKRLERSKSSLPHSAASRLGVYVHDTIPIGSAIMLDATPESGRIQVETKLYRAPRTESFGFEVSGPSPFYMRNYTAWSKVFQDSIEWEPVLIILDRTARLLAPNQQSEGPASNEELP